MKETAWTWVMNRTSEQLFRLNNKECELLKYLMDRVEPLSGLLEAKDEKNLD